jgi:hypothetical protein
MTTTMKTPSVLRIWAWALMAGLLALMPSLGFAADAPIVDKGDAAWMMTPPCSSC